MFLTFCAQMQRKLPFAAIGSKRPLTRATSPLSLIISLLPTVFLTAARTHSISRIARFQSARAFIIVLPRRKLFQRSFRARMDPAPPSTSASPTSTHCSRPILGLSQHLVTWPHRTRIPVGGEFVLKRRLGSEIGRNSAAAKRTDQAKH